MASTGKIVSSVVVGNGGKNSDNPKDYAFLHFYRVEKSLGYNGGQTRSWGGIAGYATPTSNIDNVKVEDVFVYCQFVDESRIDNIGYLVGHNQGDITEKSGKCQVINSSEHRTGNWDRGTTLKYYFGWSDGDDSIGNNEGNSPW